MDEYNLRNYISACKKYQFPSLLSTIYSGDRQSLLPNREFESIHRLYKAIGADGLEDIYNQYQNLRGAGSGGVGGIGTKGSKRKNSKEKKKSSKSKTKSKSKSKSKSSTTALIKDLATSALATGVSVATSQGDASLKNVITQVIETAIIPQLRKIIGDQLEEIKSELIDELKSSLLPQIKEIITSAVDAQTGGNSEDETENESDTPYQNEEFSETFDIPGPKQNEQYSETSEAPVSDEYKMIHKIAIQEHEVSNPNLLLGEPELPELNIKRMANINGMTCSCDCVEKSKT